MRPSKRLFWTKSGLEHDDGGSGDEQNEMESSDFKVLESAGWLGRNVRDTETVRNPTWANGFAQKGLSNLQFLLHQFQ